MSVPAARGVLVGPWQSELEDFLVQHPEAAADLAAVTGRPDLRRAHDYGPFDGSAGDFGCPAIPNLPARGNDLQLTHADDFEN